MHSPAQVSSTEVSHVSNDDRFAAFCKLNCCVRGWKGASAPTKWLDAPNQFPDYGFALLAENAISLPHPACAAQGGFWAIRFYASPAAVHPSPNARYVTYRDM